MHARTRKLLEHQDEDIKVAFLLTMLNPDFAIGNKISRSIYGQTNLRLQSKQSTSEGGSFRLETKAAF